MSEANISQKGVNIMTEFEIYRGSNTERYVLGTKGNKTLVIIGINPSTADEERTDRTITRVIKHTQQFGYDSFKMINIYPLRATNFNKLPKEFNEKLHKQNIIEIKKTIETASAVLCAWGTHINDRKYFKICYSDILKIISGTTLPTYCLGVTKHGHPLHPLLRGIATPEKLVEFDMINYNV